MDISKRSTFYLPSVYKFIIKHLTSHLICDPQTIIQKLIDSSFWKLRFRSSAGDHSMFIHPIQTSQFERSRHTEGTQDKSNKSNFDSTKAKLFPENYLLHLKSRLTLRVAEVEGQQNTTLNL